MEELSLPACNITNGEAQLICQLMTSLQQLNLSWNELTVFPSLGALQSLQRLDLSRNSITNVPQASVGTRLRSLNLEDCPMGSDLEFVLAFPELQDLEELNLSGGASLSSELAKRLVSLKKLHTCILDRTRISPAGAKILGTHTSLKKLSLFRDNLDDAQLGALLSGGGLQNLEKLSLEDNRIGDTGAFRLLLPKLRILNMKDTRISDQGKLAIVHQLKKLEQFKPYELKDWKPLRKLPPPPAPSLMDRIVQTFSSLWPWKEEEN